MPHRWTVSESWQKSSWQIESDGSQILGRELQILCGRRSRRVTQHVADDLERHTRSEQAHGACVAKRMGAFPSLRSDSGCSQTSARDTVENRSILERAVRRLDTQEYLPMYA